MPKNAAQQKQQNWYISRAYFKLREAKNYSRLGKCAEAVNSSFESIEFSVKALCKVLDVEYNPEHFLDELTVVKLAEKIGETWKEKKEKILSILPVILSYSNTLREMARYGIEKKDNVGPISPDQIFKKDYCDKVLQDAQILVDILSQIEISQRWDVSKPIKIGIFNGFSINQSTEKRCEPIITFKNVNFWKHHFSGLKTKIPKYDVKSISSSEISEEFAVIINPFGEAYPESNVHSRDTYEQIKFFIENGGVFANTAGFAFFYSWDNTKGERNAISEQRFLLIPREANKIKGLQEFLGFSGTLLYLDFRAFVTSDEVGHTGAHEVETFQTKEDITKFGKLGPFKLKEFRALRSETTKNIECIPILRAKCPVFGEIYPIAVIRFGKGFLLVGGFIMETEEEAKLFANAIDAFSNWMSKYVHTL
jgi:HEPN domain-containing protein